MRGRRGVRAACTASAAVLCALGLAIPPLSSVRRRGHAAAPCRSERTGGAQPSRGRARAPSDVAGRAAHGERLPPTASASGARRVRRGGRRRALAPVRPLPGPRGVRRALRPHQLDDRSCRAAPSTAPGCGCWACRRTTSRCTSRARREAFESALRTQLARVALPRGVRGRATTTPILLPRGIARRGVRGPGPRRPRCPALGPRARCHVGVPTGPSLGRATPALLPHPDPRRAVGVRERTAGEPRVSWG